MFQISTSINRTFCASSLNHSSLECAKSCPVPCNYILYNYKLSENKWPHKNYVPFFYEKIIKNDSYLTDRFPHEPTMHEDEVETMKTLNLLRDNFLKIEISFANKGTKMIEKAEISESLMLGSLGGNLNLWIGISIFTMVELLELAINMMFEYFCKKSSSVKPEKEADHVPTLKARKNNEFT